MAVQQLFYRSAVPVSATRHGDVSVRAGATFGFAARVNSVPIVAAEFAQAGAEYPIIFAGTGDSVLPAVVLGAREDENLHVDADGRWRGRYIPAFLRRYPFVFSTTTGGKSLVLSIDEAFEGVNRDGLGERLFDAEGNQTQYLQGILRFLQEYQAHSLRTQAFCRQLVELDLLQPMRAQFNLGSGQQRSLGGFKVVDRARLKALPPDELAGMCQRDELECLFLHLASLRHFKDMLAQMAPAARGGAEASEAAAEEIGGRALH